MSSDERCDASPRWYLERALFAMAGTVTIISAVLAAFVSPWFLLLTGFVGLNQWLYVIVGACPASLMMRRFLGLRPAATGTPVSAAAPSTSAGATPAPAGLKDRS